MIAGRLEEMVLDRCTACHKSGCDTLERVGGTLGNKQKKSSTKLVINNI